MGDIVFMAVGAALMWNAVSGMLRRHPGAAGKGLLGLILVVSLWSLWQAFTGAEVEITKEPLGRAEAS